MNRIRERGISRRDFLLTRGTFGVSAALLGAHVSGAHSRRIGGRTLGPATFLLSQLSPNLVAQAYSQFAFLIANKAPLATCPRCSRLFSLKSGKQKYCTPRCASTSRWRRWKDRRVEQ